MPLPSDKEVFVRLIDLLNEAASCARQLAFLRSQKEWLKVDENLLTTRKLIISLAEAKERQGFIIQ